MGVVVEPVDVFVVAADVFVVPSVAAVTAVSAVSAGCPVVVSVALTELVAVAAVAPHPESSIDETSRELNI